MNVVRQADSIPQNNKPLMHGTKGVTKMSNKTLQERLDEYKHVFWLMKITIKCLFKGNIDETKLFWWFIKTHLQGRAREVKNRKE